MPPPGSCAQPGDVGNSLGIGTFCTPGGGECYDFPGAGLCLADVGQDEWFCTRIGCKDDPSVCGENVTCYVDAAGSACVPNACLDGSGGAGGMAGAGGTAGAAGAGGG
jgi:hypothetical protein